MDRNLPGIGAVSLTAMRSLKSQSRAVDGDLYLSERRCARTGNGVRNGAGSRIQASEAGLPMKYAEVRVVQVDIQEKCSRTIQGHGVRLSEGVATTAEGPRAKRPRRARRQCRRQWLIAREGRSGYSPRQDCRELYLEIQR